MSQLARRAGAILGVAAGFAVISISIPAVTGPWDGSGGAIWWYILALVGLGIASAILGAGVRRRSDSARRADSNFAYGLLWGPVLFLAPFLCWVMAATMDFMVES